jgi:dolichyl-diphosphooligosaccharide--protein glycosyltransferase
LIVPVAAYAVYRAISDPRTNRSPLAANAPLVVGLAIASILAFTPHVLWEVPSLVRSITPAMVFGGTVAVLSLGEGGYRRGLSTRSLGGIVAGASAVGAFLVVLLPPFSSVFESGVAYFQRTGSSGIAETLSLFGGNVGTIIGPVLFFGFVLFLALPYVGWALWRAYHEHEPAWFAVGGYGVYFLVLATVQLRFAGELSVVTAVFGGVGFVHLAAWVDLARVPRVFSSSDRGGETSSGRFYTRRSFSVSDRRSAVSLIFLFCLVTSLALVQIPIKQGQLTIGGDTYETAKWLEDYAEEQGASYPANYVFSEWGRNRVYNHFVSGESDSYLYAQDHYADFLSSNDGERWYHQLRNRSGFVITRPSNGNYSRSSLQNRLYNHHGSATDRASGLAHYRFVHSQGGTKTFDIVPGARIVGVANASAASFSQDVHVSDRNFRYTRDAPVNPYGLYTVTLPYPGDYEVSGKTFSVSESAIESGERTVLHDRPGLAHWPFDTGHGRVAYDRVGGWSGQISGAEWTNGKEKGGIKFTGDDDRIVANTTLVAGKNDSLTISFWIRGELNNTVRYPTVFDAKDSTGSTRVGIWGRNAASDFGVSASDTTNHYTRTFGIQQTTFRSWTHVAVVLDRGDGELRLYSNSTLVATGDASSLGSVPLNDITIGNSHREYHGVANVTVDEFRIHERVLSREEIAALNR